MLLWWEVQPKWFERLKKIKKYKNGELTVMNIIIGKQLFQIELVSNQATKKLIARLPINLKMNDLHGN